MFPGSYFAPSFFARDFFADAPAGDPPVVEVPAGPFRDFEGLLAIAGLLRGTRAFTEVRVAGGRADRPGAMEVPWAVVEPSGWSEADDGGPGRALRTVGFVVTMGVVAAESEDRLDRLDRLTAAAQGAVDGSSLGGACYPWLTRLRRGRPDATAVGPEGRVVVEGSFVYPIADVVGRSAG